ncbi:MAG: SpoIIE family protein phosphatase [candidate division KSB1 bacterium]|nr:SpoIIE family protein phosphatase [candidate division KSB1 bacterium]MDZ7303113.1 SpoIIE family protein phosphatase [candidate division KSB1 bacterium]MDZ7312652.1 SpoIIE family protein phosphatase [candidate division KSB1 bacterium]
MAHINLKTLLGKNKEATMVIANLIATMETPIGIEDTEEQLLLGEANAKSETKYPVTLAGEILGWVSGGENAEPIAGLLTHLANKEAEKKTLGNEVLHLYREVNLIYNFSEKLAALLELETVAQMALEQARQLITATGGLVMLLNEATQRLEALAGFGEGLQINSIKLGEGIIGGIALRGNAEIINEIRSDSRYVGEGNAISSLICAPLKIKERVTGVIVLGAATPETYTAGDLKLLNTLALQTASAIENARLYEKTVQAAKDREQLFSLHKELEVASNIQKSIVPRKFPPFPERKDFEIHAAMIPAKEVGGDFFDFFLIDAERMGFVIGDVSGKGVPAALFMAVSRTLLKATALRGLPPEQCIEQVNRMLASESVSNMFVTVFYGILNTRTGDVTYCNGGHNPPYILRRDGRIEAMEMTGGLVLGVFGKATYQAKQVALRPGDGLFLYTDGITEAMDGDGNEFTENRLEICLKLWHDSTLENIVQGVVGEVKTFAAGVSQTDDMTILGLRYFGNAELASDHSAPTKILETPTAAGSVKAACLPLVKNTITWSRRVGPP